jgi:hypothetical protein
MKKLTTMKFTYSSTLNEHHHCTQVYHYNEKEEFNNFLSMIDVYAIVILKLVMKNEECQ